MISEGDFVVIKWHDDRSTNILRVRGEQKLGKLRVPTKPLVGHPYESVFELRDKAIVRVEDDPGFLERVFDDLQASGEGNNSSYVDSNSAQRLRDEDIRDMKDAGATGIDIMRSLIANSETWAVKTEFAQQKWLSRKSRKYLRRFRASKTTPSLMCEVLFNKNSENICGLRGDAVAQMLSHGGVYAGARVLVCDTTLGLVAGAIAFRMRGHGRILSIFTGQQPHLEYIEPLNLTDKELEIIRSVPCVELASAADDVQAAGLLNSNESDSMSLSDPSPKPNGRSSGKPYHSSCKKPYELQRARQLLREGVNSLVLVSHFRPLVVLQEAIYLLVPSSPFAVYCEYMEPLVECYLFLQTRGIAIRLNLSETWVRDYQTLPGRFHPAMNMRTSGGYILSGVYIGGLLVKESTDTKVTQLNSGIQEVEGEPEASGADASGKRKR